MRTIRAVHGYLGSSPWSCPLSPHCVPSPPLVQGWTQALWTNRDSASNEQQTCTWGALSYDQGNSVVGQGLEVWDKQLLVV